MINLILSIFSPACLPGKWIFFTGNTYFFFTGTFQQVYVKYYKICIKMMIYVDAVIEEG